MNLYNLPKDILVKLLTTIQEDTKREIDIKLESVFKKINYKAHYFFYKCSVKDCNCYQVADDCGEILYINSEPINQCFSCFKNFCKKHSEATDNNKYKRYLALQKNGIQDHICLDCFENPNTYYDYFDDEHIFN